MGFIRSINLLAAIGLLTAGCSSPQGTVRPAGDVSINYAVSVPDPASENFHVEAVVNNITLDTMTFYFPIWGPGAYDIVTFGAYVNQFTATANDGAPLKVIRADQSTFKIVGARPGMRLSYKVHDIESADNSAWFGLSDIESNYAFANTPAIFGYPAGYKDIPYTVSYRIPSGWDIAIGLDRIEGFTYRAQDYDELVDAPLTMGKFQRFEFDVQGKPHTIALFAPEKLSQADAQGLIDSSRKIVSIISEFFGDMPYDHYVFQYFLVEPRPDDYIYGALEHRNSSTYRMPYRDGEVGESLGPVITHEYWHTWSPKRIHVRELGPFDYQRPPRTNSLWFAEGLTEYYAKVLMTRNDMMPISELVADLEEGVETFGSGPQRESITDLSMRVSEVPPTQVFSLYSKGPLLGFLLDAEIRLQTENKMSLDDVMRHFNREYGRTGKTFGDDDIIPIMEKVTGANLREFYHRYISGRDPLPFLDYLPRIGFSLEEYTDSAYTLGGEVAEDAAGWKVTRVESGGSLERMGAHVGDVLTELRGIAEPAKLNEIPPQVAELVVQQLPPNGLRVGVLRNGEDLELPIVLKAATFMRHKVAINRGASGLALAVRRGMIGR